MSEMGFSMQIIGVTGLPSSGKGTFSKVALEYDFEEIIMGDVIREELKFRNLEINRENSNRIMVKLREEKGSNVIADITTNRIMSKLAEGHQRILIDGIRSMAEVEHFRLHFPSLCVIAIHADPESRFQRSKARKRRDDAYSREEFERRDAVELGVGIGDVIALSDILIASSKDLDGTLRAFREVLDELIDTKIGVYND
ncbi:MAG: AAA family ATPase [Candidatus Kariarchaeaceae archaeon]|jgi:dephospho-CoA kinase